MKDERWKMGCKKWMLTWYIEEEEERMKMKEKGDERKKWRKIRGKKDIWEEGKGGMSGDEIIEINNSGWSFIISFPFDHYLLL